MGRCHELWPSQFASGWFFGRKDANFLPLYDIGFRFHLATYVIYHGISLLWFALALNAKQETIDSLYRSLLLWGFFLAIHFIFYLRTRKDTIKNLSKDDLFE
ncbi:hypothetical protein [Olivibacter sp. XZL3]|uniref:hypothetical protein n=1 Tax=Olivibacter sp. XZL3 TaxID=1735116 RepID=UPI001064E950|nr:hypothetical protein [Olivibacter sp. XZL3]